MRFDFRDERREISSVTFLASFRSTCVLWEREREGEREREREREGEREREREDARFRRFTSVSLV